MNEITRVEHPDHAELVRVLQNSLYPGASVGAIELVMSWCRVNNIDPMLRPVHIVSSRAKNERGQWESRDILMPGIALYRILAARSGEYGGKSEPEFGPDQTETLDGVKVTFPKWCKVTVSRIIGGQARAFTAVEYWLENYSTAGRDRETGRVSEAPNAMWKKRAYGQLAKCTEAQALRQAFPEFSGGGPSAEEMEGKDSFAGTTIDHTAEPAKVNPVYSQGRPAEEPPAEGPEYPFATAKGGQIYRTGSEWMERWRRLADACRLTGALDKLQAARDMNEAQIAAVAEFDPEAAQEVREMVQAMLATQAPPAEDEGEMSLP